MVAGGNGVKASSPSTAYEEGAQALYASNMDVGYRRQESLEPLDHESTIHLISQTLAPTPHPVHL